MQELSYWNQEAFSSIMLLESTHQGPVAPTYMDENYVFSTCVCGARFAAEVDRPWNWLECGSCEQQDILVDDETSGVAYLPLYQDDAPLTNCPFAILGGAK